MGFVFDSFEKIQDENAENQHVLLFLQCFLKSFLKEHKKKAVCCFEPFPKQALVFYVSAIKIVRKHSGKRRNCS